MWKRASDHTQQSESTENRSAVWERTHYWLGQTDVLSSADKYGQTYLMNVRHLLKIIRVRQFPRWAFSLYATKCCRIRRSFDFISQLGRLCFQWYQWPEPDIDPQTVLSMCWHIVIEDTIGKHMGNIFGLRATATRFPPSNMIPKPGKYSRSLRPCSNIWIRLVGPRFNTRLFQK